MLGLEDERIGRYWYTVESELDREIEQSLNSED